MQALIVLVVAGSAVLAQAAEPPSPEKAAADDAAQIRQLQHRFAQRFYEKAIPNLKGLSADEVRIKLFPLAEKHWKDVFGPHHSLLKRHVSHLLAELGKAEELEPSKYEVVGEAGDLISRQREFTGAVPAAFLWNPLFAAENAKLAVMARTLSPGEFGPRAMLNALVPPGWQTIDRDLGHPKLVQRMGREVVIVELERKNDAYYVPSNIRWLRLKQARE